MKKFVQLGKLITPAKTVRCGMNRYPVLSMTMHDGIMLQSDRFKKNIASVDQSNYKVIRRGQFVVGFPIDEGVLYIQKVADVGIMSPAYNVWDVDTDKIDLDYFELSLHSPQAMQYYKSHLRGTTARRRSLPTEALLSLEIYVPSLAEQKHIADVLDRISGLIALRKRQLAKFDELVRARFVEMFGDIYVNPKYQLASIGTVCSLKSGTTLPIDIENEGGNIPYIKVGDMNIKGNEREITTSTRYVSEETAGKGIFPPGTVLFPKRGGAISTNKKRLTITPVCADLNVMGVTPLNGIIPEYLFICFAFIDLGSLYNGSSVPQINNKDIAPLKIPIPPLYEQQKFASFVKHVDALRATAASSLTAMTTLKSALMQEYFG